MPGRTLEEVATYCSAELVSPSGAVADGVSVAGVATLASAGPSQVSFLANPRYRSALADTRAAAVLVHPEQAGDCPVPALVHSQPYLAFARVARWLHPVPLPAPGISEAATVARTADVDGSAHIGAGAVIGEAARVAANAVVGPGCVLGENVSIGESTRLVANVTVLRACEVGARCVLHAGVVVGADGFGIAKNDSGAWENIPQIGRVIIADDVEIGANTCIDRGALEDTVIGQGVKLDNLIQVGHGVRIGAHTAIAACTAIAGSAHIGERCTIQGACAIAGHLTIADDVTLTATSAVPATIAEAGTYSSGMPIQPNARWRRNAIRMTQLDDFARRLRALERRLDESTNTTEHPGNSTDGTT